MKTKPVSISDIDLIGLKIDPDMSDLIIDVTPQKNELSSQVQQTVPQQTTDTNEDKLEKDLQIARETIAYTIKVGKDAIDQAVSNASLSDHPKWLEVTSQLITALGTNANNLVGLHKKEKDIKKADKSEPTVVNNTQNNLYMTTEDLIKMINGNVTSGDEDDG